eukprot:TRINITY_DN6433_c0_g1_i5.p1 TRINITY_DN6433_c0_g1~~TRINITY_DN6433_c0_g1_i5.p1  ORF type:complete len:429 (+),score=77.91 TRINITY_DN6433_c0_g1_i5:135-1421(+)
MLSLSSSLHITINSYFVQNGFVFYPVLVTPARLGEKKPWTVAKRFSNFDKLYKQLIKTFTGIPARPKKTIFQMKAHKDLEQRRKELEIFCNRLLEKKELLEDLSVIEFFEIGENAPELTTKEWRCVLPKEVVGNCITSFIYDQDDHTIILAEKGSEAETRSLLKCYEFAGKPEIAKPTSYTHKWTSKIPEEATCLAYDSHTKTFVCGTDTGLIYILNLNNPDEGNLSIHSHSKTVTSICFENVEKYIISVGADKMIVGTSFDGKIIYSTRLGDLPLSCVTCKESRVAAANVGGEVFVCDVNCVKVVPAITASAAEETILGVMEAADEILVCVMNREVRWYAAKKFDKALSIWKSDKQITSWGIYKSRSVAVGNAAGELAFIDLLSGKQKLLLRCHNGLIKDIFIDPSDGRIMSVSNDSGLLLRKWPVH